jgi:hypothetical protein
MTLKLFAVASLPLLLASCQLAQVKTIQGPDGTKNHLISCSSVEHCYAKAAEICGKYSIVNTSSDTSSLGDKSPTSTTVNLLVKCNR